MQEVINCKALHHVLNAAKHTINFKKYLSWRLLMNNTEQAVVRQCLKKKQKPNIKTTKVNYTMAT